jgi:hypothetical protein
MDHMVLSAGLRHHTVAGPLRWVKVHECTDGQEHQSPRNPLGAMQGILLSLACSAAIWLGVASVMAIS